MKSKFALFLSMAALTGGVLAALPGQACIFSDRANTSAIITGDGAGSSGSSINFNAPNKFGMAGLAALGLIASGLFLKAQISKRSEAAPEAAPEAAAEPAMTPKAASVFPIQVPAAALADHDQVEAGIR
jgi:hypothetical protein